jgi:broad specificity phosphatase PhoE
MKILFVRHGESVDDIENRYGGWADFDLTENGKKQITECTKSISSLDGKFEVILSSPLKRALQAANIISNQLNIKVEVFEYLKERNLNGILTGMIKSEAKIKYPDQVKRHENYQYVDGSEREEDMVNRVKYAATLLSNMKYNSVIGVTHGLFIKTFFKQMIGMNIKSVGNGGFIFVDIVNGKLSVLESEGIDLE